MLPDDMELSKSYTVTYDDYVSNADGQLREEFPGKDIPRVPAKNRTSTAAPGIRDTFFNNNGGESDKASRTSSESSTTASSPSSPSLPANSPPPNLRVTTPVSKRDKILRTLAPRPKEPASDENHLPREKNRLTLRSFLRQIIKDKRLAKSKALAAFLLHDPIQELSKEEEADIERRLEMDRLRLTEQKQFIEESRKRARELDVWLRGFKKELIKNRILLECGTNSRGVDKII